MWPLYRNQPQPWGVGKGEVGSTQAGQNLRGHPRSHGHLSTNSLQPVLPGAGGLQSPASLPDLLPTRGHPCPAPPCSCPHMLLALSGRRPRPVPPALWSSPSPILQPFCSRLRCLSSAPPWPCLFTCTARPSLLPHSARGKSSQGPGMWQREEERCPSRAKGGSLPPPPFGREDSRWHGCGDLRTCHTALLGPAGSP